MKKRSPRRALEIVALLAAVLLLRTGPVMAHNSWLVASENSAKGPGTVRLAFITTEHFWTSEYSTRPARVDEWTVRLGESRWKVRDYRIEGKELAAEVTLDEPGVHVVAASLAPYFKEFDAETFNRYLAEESATEAAALRKTKGQRNQPGRMYYTKLAKTFVEIGGERTEDFKKPVGHVLEIVPLSNPCRWRVGDEVAVQLLYDGKPAVDFPVSSGHGGLPPHIYAETIRTDANGQARFKLPRPGLWFIRAHHIRPFDHTKRKEKDSPPADWESFWSSITFRVQNKLSE